MTTAEHVKAITDRALYEQLANAVLRGKFEHLSNLIVGGLNEKGETVKGKLDSFCSVDGNKFYIVEHTTDDSNLEKKWLYDNTSYTGKKPISEIGNGDLIKVIERAKEIKSDNPSAKFTVYLTTNQLVDEELWAKVITCGSNNDIDVQLLELSVIASFLDHDPHGQFLRKQFLNIDQELLSLEKVFEILNENLNQYKSESFIDPQLIDKEWQLQELVDHYYNEQDLLTLIIADSGMGKSTLCYSLLEELLRHPLFGFRVKPEMILQANNVFHLIELFLLSYDNKLFVNDDFREFFNGDELVIVVDDINHCINRSEVLDKLISWSIEMKNDPRDIDFKILCPIWPRYFQQIERLEKKRAGFNYFRLPEPNDSVVETFISKGLADGVTLTKPEIKDLNARSGNDPLLIGLNLEMINRSGGYSLNQGTKVLRDFVFDKLASSSANLNYPQFKQRNILSSIGEAMLRNRNITPSYDDLSGWFEQDVQTLALIDALATDRQLLFVKDDGGIQFRHDRIRDFIVSKGFSSLFTSIENNGDIISDPFFSNLLAVAIADNRPEYKILAAIAEKNPESLFYTIKYVQASDDISYLKHVKELLEKWLDGDKFPANNMSLLASISWGLLETDTSDLQTLTSKLPPSRNLHMARFKSGDCVSAINYFSDLMDFEPSIGNELRDQILDHVRHYHYQKIVSDLKAILQENKLDDRALRGSFLLAGHLKDPSLPMSLQHAWNTGDKKELYPHYLWAVINCTSTQTRGVLIDGLNYFNDLPDEGDEQGYPEGVRNESVYHFSMVRWKLTEEQVLILDDLYIDHGLILQSVFDLLDHPRALKRSISQLSSTLNNLPSGHPYSIMHPDDKWVVSKCGYRMPERSLNSLKECWSDQDRPATERLISYKYWSDNASTEAVVKFSRLITRDDNVLYNKAIQKRAISGDFTVVDQYIELTDNSMLIQFAYHIWTEKLKKQCSLMFQLERNKPQFTFMAEILTKLLKKIPQGDAEELLVENWEFIKRFVFGVQVALYLQTEKSLQLVDQAIEETSEPASLFLHLHSTFGFWDPGMQGRITGKFLKTLNPYLQYLSEFSVNSIAQICFRLGFTEWVLNDLLLFMKPAQQRFYRPATSDLLAEMRDEKYMGQPFAALSWLSTVKDRKLPTRIITPALEIYAKEISSFPEYKFLTDCLFEIGTRTHLGLLDIFVPDNDMIQAVNGIKGSVIHSVMEKNLN
ncbi:MAG: hypothetical protein EOO20_04790 [Chryseobacterium sp.]|uniref:hypothetical protein n=1 Tax=Pedobacter agri TaxID=454586 RepID=UPI00122717B7|nr:hypothetical protein [Pedobacter agri]RZJ91505.1 MAG: hypothetical protein EOO20_04790 [Chryseobacterium sp.]